MAASKKGSATSKTAHVMNLLNKNREADAAPENAASSDTVSSDSVSDAASPAPDNAVSKKPASPMDTLQRDALASEQIKSALEEAFVEENGAPAAPEPASAPAPSGSKLSQEEIERMLAAATEPKPESEPEPAPTPAPSGGKLSQEEIERMLAAATEPEPESEPEPAPAPAPSGGKLSQEEIERMLAAAIEPEPEPEPEEKKEEKKKDSSMSALERYAAREAGKPDIEQPTAVPDYNPDDPRKGIAFDEPVECLNVLDKLVEQNADKYIKLLDVCTCPRCTADVKALALTNLQPKYVVLPEKEVDVWLTLYGGRFQTTVTAQIMRACEVVKEHPRHSIPDAT